MEIRPAVRDKQRAWDHEQPARRLDAAMAMSVQSAFVVTWNLVRDWWGQSRYADFDGVAARAPFAAVDDPSLES